MEVKFKNTMSLVITSFIYVATLIRDTLEYTLNRDDFNLEYFKRKRDGLINEPKINSPLANFIKQNGTKGEEFKERLEDFVDLFYGEESSIIRVTPDNKILVDHTQHITIFEKTVPMLEEMLGIIRFHYDYAVKNNMAEEPIGKLVDESERFAEGIVLMTVVPELEKKFVEFNKIMTEEKGQKSPASTFVEQELGKLLGISMRMVQVARAADNFMTNAKTVVTALVNYMTGKEKLPEGKKFQEVFKETEDTCKRLVADSESKFRELYNPCVAELAKMGSKQDNDGNNLAA